MRNFGLLCLWAFVASVLFSAKLTDLVVVSWWVVVAVVFVPPLAVWTLMQVITGLLAWADIQYEHEREDPYEDLGSRPPE